MKIEHTYEFSYEIMAGGHCVGEVELRCDLDIACDLESFHVEGVRNVEFYDHPDYHAPQDDDKAAKALAHEITQWLLSKEGQKKLENELSENVPEWVSEQREANAEYRHDFMADR